MPDLKRNPVFECHRGSLRHYRSNAMPNVRNEVCGHSQFAVIASEAKQSSLCLGAGATGLPRRVPRLAMTHAELAYVAMG